MRPSWTQSGLWLVENGHVRYMLFLDSLPSPFTKAIFQAATSFVILFDQRCQVSKTSLFRDEISWYANIANIAEIDLRYLHLDHMEHRKIISRNPAGILHILSGIDFNLFLSTKKEN